ncbi:MAG: S8 family serine peptidase [Candidatus Vecturithrix sp.]|jgi:hypothetical protein|nr:S8 family serine peptidase [Candidatus Vecturithrix sp.]
MRQRLTFNNSWKNKIPLAKNAERYIEVKEGAEKHNINYIWSAGNITHGEIDDGTGNKIQTTIDANTNYDWFTNSRYTIAVGASGQYGEAHEYSAPGSTVLVNAPSGLDTADRLGAEGYNQSSGEIRFNKNILDVLHGTRQGFNRRLS